MCICVIRVVFHRQIDGLDDGYYAEYGERKELHAFVRSNAEHQLHKILYVISSTRNAVI